MRFNRKMTDHATTIFVVSVVLLLSTLVCAFALIWL
jgi:hypothetical protein